jgi:hypothetical protein
MAGQPRTLCTTAAPSGDASNCPRAGVQQQQKHRAIMNSSEFDRRQIVTKS